MKTESFWREPNFPGEYQALGLVLGVWFPKGDNKSTTGWLLCDQGCSQIESSILGKDTREFIYSHAGILVNEELFQRLSTPGKWSANLPGKHAAQQKRF
jgi:hypothetical protein